MDVPVRDLQTHYQYNSHPETLKSFAVSAENRNLSVCVPDGEDVNKVIRARMVDRDIAVLGVTDSSSGSPSSSRARRYKNETEEARKARLARDAERRRQSRRMESAEDARTRRIKQAAARRYYLKYLETEEDAKRRRKQNAEHKRLRRQQMDPQERELLKRKESARRAERRRAIQEQKRKQQEEISKPDLAWTDPAASYDLNPEEELKPILTHFLIEPSIEAYDVYQSSRKPSPRSLMGCPEDRRY